MSRPPRAYFVCIGNAGRSQMAQALYERLGGEARSAGSRPEREVHPEVVEVLSEVGLDVSERRPKTIDTADAEWADVVVTMGCGDACPVLPGKRYVDWNLPDPSGRPLTEVRALRDDIARRVAELARS
ncbi:MAG TPA: arsenate reductase ArsC [Gaiellaceae bacterium]|nr:arsenate reductase ArsC [Gaiellaceae bacterium]